MGTLLTALLLTGILLSSGTHSFQIQCYQCQEFQLGDDCSEPENIANCTVNVQDVCQKEVTVRSNGTFHRKTCATSASCLITSAGYQQFCTPGRIGSVCINCCSTPLCNGPRPPRRRGSASLPCPTLSLQALLLGLALTAALHVM